MTNYSLLTVSILTVLFLFIMVTTLRVRAQISKRVYDITNPRSPYHRAIYKNKKRK